MNARPFERKTPARLKLSSMKIKYGSSYEQGNIEEINNSSALLNIEMQDKIDINMQTEDYSATFPDKSRAATAMSPYQKKLGIGKIGMGATSTLPRSMRGTGRG